VTEWCAYDSDVAAALGLSADEKIAGFLYFGTAQEPLTERERPQIASLIRSWSEVPMIVRS
jgi:hypothetical protein